MIVCARCNNNVHPVRLFFSVNFNYYKTIVRNSLGTKSHNPFYKKKILL